MGNIEKTGQIPLLSVAICTYNRSFFLRSALNSLLQQSISTESFCVIVVDNASTDDTQQVIAELGPRFAHFQAIYESQQGLSHARNAAVAACASSWLAFLDDDGKAHADWASVMLDVIRQDIFDCFGGVYLPWYYYGPPPAWFDEHSATNKGTQSFMGLLPESECPAGGNCAYRKTLFDRFGLFPVNLGMRGSSPGYGEETALIARFREHGARVGFVPHLFIDHCVLPHKYILSWQLKSIFARGRSHYHIVGQKAHITPARCLGGYAKALAKFVLHQASPRRMSFAEALLAYFYVPLHQTGSLYERYWESWRGK